jgi:hypothetical protein
VHAAEGKRKITQAEKTLYNKLKCKRGFQRLLLPRKSLGSFSVSCNKWINSVVQKTAAKENCPMEELTHKVEKTTDN